MATDTKTTNNHGNDSSGTSSPQSPLDQRGGSNAEQYAKGSVQTDFKGAK
jgi:hypothetical protein